MPTRPDTVARPGAVPNILAIAGSDPSGGAGIQADIKAISANGGYAMAAITALTVQNTRGVHAAEMLAPDFVAEQIGAVFDDIRVDAVKIGMLGTAAIAGRVADALEGLSCPVVLDPVMVAKGGDRLLSEEAVETLARRLLPHAAIVTPNLPEAGDLLGRAEATTRDAMVEQAGALLALGCGGVLLKGGHLEGAESPDLFLSRERLEWLEADRLPGGPIHGTGCTLSSALAALMAQLDEPLDAARAAKRYVAGAIAGAGALDVGGGHPPADHFHAWRGATPTR